MADITWTHVTAFASELSSVDEEAQAMILAHVNGEHGVAVDEFGGEDSPTTKLVRIYLAAHLGTMCGMGAAGGMVTSESAGGLARSYATGVGLEGADLDLTVYGRTVRGFARRFSGGPRVI
jgi:hypothetical protein